MTDLLMLACGALFVIAIALVMNLVERRSACKHRWGRWQFARDENAFVQLRACEHCGFTEIHQTKRPQGGNDGNRA